MAKEGNDSGQTLKELLAGIIVFGILEQIIFFLIAEKKRYLTIGLWFGVILAILAACHMYYSLNRALDLGGGAAKYVMSQNMVRYGVIVVAFGILCVLDFGNPLSAFAGIMCLKAGAYLQPFTHKILSKVKRR